MNAFVLIIPIVFAIVVSQIVIPPYAPERRIASEPTELTQAEIRQRLRAQRYREAMKVESVTAGDSDW